MNKFKLALFGDPVEHSLSPKIHHAFAKQFGLDVDYRLIKTSTNKLHESVVEFFEKGGHGCNITLPHKQSIIKNQLIKKQSFFVQRVKVANTLYHSNNQLIADNTDGKGFINDLCKEKDIPLKNKKVLILGSGGAVPSLLLSIYLECPKLVIVANRTLSKAKQVCQYDSTHAVSLEMLDEIKHQFDVIIHASSLGHYGKSLKFQKHHIHADTVAYDLSYGEVAKPFLTFCQKHDLKTILEGKGMLIHQAALSFEKWFGKRPDTHISI